MEFLNIPGKEMIASLIGMLVIYAIFHVSMQSRPSLEGVLLAICVFSIFAYFKHN